MAQSTDSDDERRQLANLDSTVISIPLLERLDSDAKGDEEHRVIVELNILHRMGRRETKQRVEGMIAGIAGEKAINRALADDTDQYVFATLASNEIRKLAQRM